MKSVPRFFLLLLVVASFVICAFVPARAGGDEWRAIDPAELASKTPVVERDAEAIFWEVRVDRITGWICPRQCRLAGPDHS